MYKSIINSCVLTQEQSKRFIQGNETDKYDFFLKATGLELTAQELQKIKEEVAQTQAFLEGGNSKLSNKLDRVRVCKEEVERFRQFDKLEKDIRESIVKRFWVDYHMAEDTVRRIEAEITKLEGLSPFSIMHVL